MASRTKGKPRTAASSLNKENGNVFVLLRDSSGNARVVLRNELVSAKQLNKLVAGDEVTHGQRSNRFRGTILQMGSEQECMHSLTIIERTKKTLSQTTKNKEVSANASNFNANEEENDECEKRLTIESDTSSQSEKEEMEIDEEEDVITDPPASQSPSTTTSKQSTQAAARVLVDSNAVKRKLSDTEERTNSNRKPTVVESSVPYKVHAAVVRRLASVEAENEQYAAFWMPRPKTSETIEYFVKIGRILGGSNDDEEEDKGERLFNIMETLNMTEGQLHACHDQHKGIFVTARKVMKAKYPNPYPGFGFADVPLELIKAAQNFARMMHPSQKQTKDADLNKAMGNVFATLNYKQKKTADEDDNAKVNHEALANDSPSKKDNEPTKKRK